MITTEELIRIDEGASGTLSNALPPLASQTLAAPSTLLVSVTDDDIRQGDPGNYRACPIAHALWRVFPEATSITVAEDETAEVVVDGFFYRLPDEAVRFVETFDVQDIDDVEYVDAVHAFQFELEPD